MNDDNDAELVAASQRAKKKNYPPQTKKNI